MLRLTCHCPESVVLPRYKQRLIWALASRYSKVCKYPLSNSAGVASMTLLTWTRGLPNISTEGGPERKLYGP